MIGETAAAEIKRPFAQEMIVAFGLSWFIVGVRPWMGLTEEQRINSTFARRYIPKYRKLYAEQQKKLHEAGGEHH